MYKSAWREGRLPMWLGLFAANVGGDGGRHQAVVKSPQRAIAAPVRLGWDAAAV